jgi:PKD domain-containing protein/Big-like domain-containing protein
MRPQPNLFAILGTLLVTLAGSTGAADTPPTIGGPDVTSENFTSTGGWRAINMTPGWVPFALTGNHLLISEVAPRGAGTGAVSDSSEYMEIANPTSSRVALDNYYVSDDFNYYQIVNGPYGIPPIADFNLRFPPGTFLDPGEVLLVVKSELGFLTTFGGLAGWNSFCAANAPSGSCTNKIFAMDNRVHPPSVFTPMIDAAGSSLGTSAVGGGDIADGTGVFTNPGPTNGEWVVLYQWDGASDLVCDVDYASWGVAGNNPKMDKGTLTVIDGPDPDMLASRYNNDTPAASQSNLGGGTALTKPNTYQRVDGEVGESMTGGNGCTSGSPTTNAPPTLAVIGAMTVDEGSLLSFAAFATDPDIPAQALTFALEPGAPAGASITSTGAFTWTPTEAQGPGDYSITIRVIDGGSPPLSDAKSFSVHVNEVNSPPQIISVLSSLGVDEGQLVSLPIPTYDPDVPANTLTFSLDPGAPTGASITPAGLFTWTPTEAQGPGDYSITVRVTDNGSPPLSDTKPFSVRVNEVNSPPQITSIPGPFGVDEGQLVSFAISANDPDLPTNMLTFSLAPGAPAGASITPAGVFSWTPTEAQGPDLYFITARVTDNGSPPLSADRVFSMLVSEVNSPPVFNRLPGPLAVNEGDVVSFTATATDADIPANTIVYSLSWPSPPDATIDPSTGAVSWRTTDDGTFTLRVVADDRHAGIVSADVTVSVLNVSPTVAITGPPAGSLFAVGTPVTFTGTFADPGAADTHTARWTFDTITQAGTVDENAHTVGASYTFTSAGVYMVSLNLTDDDGGVGTSNQVGGLDAMVVIYDPSAGFVTGGGWIDSPAGAYAADPTLTGRANFGFVSKYQKGVNVPTGETEFQYKVGNLNFHSTSYDWLVVGGAKAQYKGSGTINNAGDYSFILTSIDGEISGGGGQDKFRMKITNKTGGGLVYDNLLNAPDSNDPTTVLDGGSIVIHTSGNSMSVMAGAARGEGGGEAGSATSIPIEYGLSQNYPNPFDRSTVIDFSLPERSRITLVVYDLQGREVRTLVDGEWVPGRHSATLTKVSSNGGTLGAGVYFVRMNAQSLASGRSFTSLRKMVLVR